MGGARVSRLHSALERVTIPGASRSVRMDNPVDFNRAVLEVVGHH
jgi:hypothetical protein